jgi:hypothetical protein
MISATDVESTAAHGPSTIATSVAPTACAVVPPGTGTLNIIMVKVKAEKTASSGAVRPPTARRTRAEATSQKGVAAT